MGVVKLAQASLNFCITLGAGPWLSDCFREVKVFQTKENGLKCFLYEHITLSQSKWSSLLSVGVYRKSSRSFKNERNSFSF